MLIWLLLEQRLNPLRRIFFSGTVDTTPSMKVLTAIRIAIDRRIDDISFTLLICIFLKFNKIINPKVATLDNGV